MRIAFLSSLDPENIRNWSGTLYYMYHQLQKKHQVTWVGGDLMAYARKKQQEKSGYSLYRILIGHSAFFGKILSHFFLRESYDLIFCRDDFFLADLITDIPVIYIGDTTYRLFRSYDPKPYHTWDRISDDLERRSIQKADRLVYSSEWAANSAVTHYGADPEKVTVLEFGANLSVPEPFPFGKTIRDGQCHLLFIGREWERKRGQFALEVYQALKKLSDCTVSLSLVGCTPPFEIEDDGVMVYPDLDKRKVQDCVFLDSLFRKSHFLIAPTCFECYGIVNCEAAAYGLPVMTSDVGGIPQIIHSGENGYLFSLSDTPDIYAQVIHGLLQNIAEYEQMSGNALESYRTRLNWERWGKVMDGIMEQLVESSKHLILSTYVAYVQEKKEVKKRLSAQFNGRKEFNCIWMAVKDMKNIDLWNCLVKAVKDAMEKEEEVISFCLESHSFTVYYTYPMFLRNVLNAHQKHMDLLLGGKSRPVQFFVIFASLFEKILLYDFQEADSLETVLLELSQQTLVFYPDLSNEFV